MRTTILIGSALLLTLAACSDGDTSGAGGGPSDALSVPDPGDGFQVAFTANIAAGTEVHVCREFVVPGSGAIDVASYETQVPEGMHHVLAYHTKKTAADVEDGVFDCGDVPGAIFYEQSADAEGSRFPDGVGIRLEGGEVVRLELHALNVGTDQATADLALNVLYATSPLEQEAGSFFMYDRDIAIAAHGKFTAKMHCEIPDDITILDVLPHVHVRGVAQRMYVGGGDIEERRLFLSTNGYGDQEIRKFDDGELVVKKGQFIEFECDYDNDTDEDTVEGPTKDHNEMCMLLGDYYPRTSREGEWCTGIGSGPIHEGSHTCADAYDALQSGKNLDFASEEVMVGVCPAAADAWNALGNCGFNNCADVCPGPECNACAAPSCAAEYGQCLAAVCDDE